MEASLIAKVHNMKLIKRTPINELPVGNHSMAELS